MSIPGFSAEASVYRSAVPYGPALSWGGGSNSVVRPAQDSSCFANCFELCAVQCFANPFWTWGSCLNNCSSKCTLQPCPVPLVCQNGSCVCAPPFTVCNGACTSLQNDPSNCGSCGNQCPPWNFCEGGQCFPIM